MNTCAQRVILFAFGTRPEAIKLLPVIRAFRADAAFDTRLCVTGQHRELLDEFLTSFNLRPDFHLGVMVPGQSLAKMTARIITACETVFMQVGPDLVFVQGDTTSAYAAATAASHCGLPVAHIEAGLRSHQKSSPFPEELNRVLIGHMAELHFAPGAAAAENLRREGITQGVHIVGNTVVDALRLTLTTMIQNRVLPPTSKDRRRVVVTFHRRESLGQPLENLCAAVRRLAGSFPEVDIFCPVHLNPLVGHTIRTDLAGISNVHLLPPLAYRDFIGLLSTANLVISDSGGVLEEAETLGLPVLVAREVTERGEAIAAGNARLVGTDAERLYASAAEILRSAPGSSCCERPLRQTFGDGYASARILRATRQHLAVDADQHLTFPALPTAA